MIVPNNIFLLSWSWLGLIDADSISVWFSSKVPHLGDFYGEPSPENHAVSLLVEFPSTYQHSTRTQKLGMWMEVKKVDLNLVPRWPDGGYDKVTLHRTDTRRNSKNSELYGMVGHKQIIPQLGTRSLEFPCTPTPSSVKILNYFILFYFILNNWRTIA